MATAPSSRAVRPRPSNEQLAKQLMDCALFVKKGQKSPLLNQTIHDLMEFMATENGDASPRQHQHQHGSSNRQEAAVSKPTKPALAMLGKMVGVTTSSSSPTGSHRSDASKRATSSKNAARAKADLQQQMQQHHGSAGKSTWYAGHHDESEWCDVHFCMGCACKEGTNNSNPKAVPTATQRAPPSPTRSAASSAATSHQHPATSSSSTSSKPAFQRPTNPKSSLIANGWIEQQRRSKMRIVWKDVLASLVEGRKPGEETTLWIQREVTDSSTGKPKLEALHQIPCKWIQYVTLEQYAADNKFSLKVYNLTDEFVFRCPSSEVAAQEWVSTLLSLKESTQAGGSKAKKNEPRNAVDEWENENKVSSRPQRSSFEDEKKSDTTTTTKNQAYPQRPTPPPAGSGSGGATSAPGGGRISVTELRAIAHGAGINTVGMERGELEAVVAKLASNAMQVSSQPPPPPPPQHHHRDPAELERRRQQEELARMKQKTMEEKARSQQPFDEDNGDDANEDGITKQQKAAAEEEAAAKRRAAEEEEASRRKAEEEEEAARRRAVEKEEDEARRQADEEARKAKEAEEEHRRRIAERVHKQQHEARLKKEEEERKRLEAERLEREEEEHRRRVAEMQAAEERRRQEEMLRQQQQQWQQQQQQWQQQQAEEAKRAAEERRRHEEHLRQQQQQWHQQQQHAAQQQHWQQQQHQQPHWQQHQQVPPHGFQGHPNQQQFPRPPQQPHNAQHPHGPPPPNTGSPINMKYAQMAHQTENQNAMSEQGIKHAVLVEWALQPPMLQVLRPIEVLISSIHNVFPPRFGIQPHDYFSKWRGLSLSDVTLGPSEGNRPDAKKLERAKKKLQLFLHTDKHPKDFTAQQSFLCRLLWDISNDAWNEYKTKEEELGWMR